MSVNEAECKAITAAVQANDCIFAVGHVMRYTPYSTQIKRVVDSGVLGRVINIQHLEPVGYYHFAHRYGPHIDTCQTLTHNVQLCPRQLAQ
jgi:predicted dehydrogenase